MFFPPVYLPFIIMDLWTLLAILTNYARPSPIRTIALLMLYYYISFFFT